MKQNRSFPAVVITKKQERIVKGGHPWVYADEITRAPEEIENGSLVDVFGSRGNYLGTGFWSACSQIRVRLLDHNANETFTDAFFARRVRYALMYRRQVMGEDFSACRLVHGEADGLPGLTVDRYNDLLVSEILSYGMEQRKAVIYRALVEELGNMGIRIRGIYERNEGELRRKEGLPQTKGWAEIEGLHHPEKAETIISENGIRYHVDIENGQKTGFFLDQKYNRLTVRKIARGRTVLDCCTHTGSFALNAAAGGAAHVTALDISERALTDARTNAALNGLEEKIDFVQGDIMEVLPRLKQAHVFYDLIILDPPAFTKSRRTVDHARMGYEKINTLAMSLLPRGGYLASASCSHFISVSQFREMLAQAGRTAGVQVRIVEERHAAPDHPVMLSIPETEYLKFFLVQVV